MQNKNETNIKRRSERYKQKKRRKRTSWKKIFTILISVGLVISLMIGGLVAYWIATAPNIDAAKLEDPLPYEIYDINEEFVTSIGTENRKKITYEDLPPLLIDAVIATEDARFFKHSGIDLRRIGGAIKANITQGFGSEGASTITQQVVENSFLTPDKKLKLKVQEQWLALNLERKYSKEQILEIYLNKIFYGSNAYGVAQAAETYFGKTNLHELNLAEAAILAGLPQRPTAYNPFKNPELTEKRMDTVLKLMVRHNKISEEEAEKARNVKVEDLLVSEQPKNETPYEAYRQQIELELKEKLDDVDIYTSGLKVYTNLDVNTQEYVEFLLKNSEENPINYPDDKMQIGMTVLDTKTGGISAIGGRRNSKGQDEFNYAIQGKMQPGSTAKPYMAFAPAIEKNKLSTYHQINDDKPFVTASGTEIRNWDRQSHGWVSMREALANSWNVPTVKLMEETGLQDAKKFAENLDIEFKDNQVDVRDAIGGTGTEVTPLQLAGAYHAFGNEGVYTKPHAVVKVEYPDGKTVNLQPESKAVMADYTAYMVTDMLKTVVKSGTGTEANIPNLHIAGKTGTTTLDDRPGNPDSWFVGYTTNHTISVWAGGYVDENGKRDAIPDGYTRIPQHIFKNTMNEISRNVETPDFKKPNSVVELPIVKGSNPPKVASSGGTIELFVKGHEPSGNKEKKDTFPAVSKLNAVYDESADEIKVNWEHQSDAARFHVDIKVDGSSIKKDTLDSKNYTISNVEKNKQYLIEVTAEDKNDSSNISEPRMVEVITGGDKLGTISDLQANFIEEEKVIDTVWSYDGNNDVQFEVEVSPGENTQIINSRGFKITNIEYGTTYTINVTPIDRDGNKGSSKSISIEIPTHEENDEDDIEEEIEDEEQDEAKEENDEDVIKEEIEDEEDREDEDDETKEKDIEATREEDIEENEEE